MKTPGDHEAFLPGMKALVDPEPKPHMSVKDSRYKAMEMLQTLCVETSTILTVVVDGDPISKARPRFTKRGMPYTPAKTIEGEKRIAARLVGMTPFKSNVAVACLFFRASRQRIDVDNLMKAVLDAGTRAQIWQDDSQVTAIMGIVEFDPVNPRSILCFGEHDSSLARGDAALVSCEVCGKKFVPFGKRRRETARFCSDRCMAYLSDPVPCPTCGKMFKKRLGRTKYCSIRCRSDAMSANAKTARANRTHCRRGHLLDEANTHILANGTKRCRRCQADQAVAHRKRRDNKEG